MPNIGPILAASANLSLQYTERLLVGVQPEMFARLARPGGVLLQSNHAAFVLGHLSLYPQRIVIGLGRPPGATAFSPRYEELFKNGVECRDDAGGTIYPPMSELTGFFHKSYKAAIHAVQNAADDLFTRPNPAEGRMRELFPTIGAAFGFYLGGHMQNHLGQVSVWRRAMGLGPA